MNSACRLNVLALTVVVVPLFELHTSFAMNRVMVASVNGSTVSVRFSWPALGEVSAVMSTTVNIVRPIGAPNAMDRTSDVMTSVVSPMFGPTSSTCGLFFMWVCGGCVCML